MQAAQQRVAMSAMTTSETEEMIEVASSKVHLRKGGTGGALVILHDDVGSPGWLPFYGELARHFAVYVPSHPGYGKSELPDRSQRPRWMRDVRDMAIVHSLVLRALGLDRVQVVGLGFGGWVAAEMATMCQPQFERMVLVGAMGVQPPEGEIVDQFLLDGEEYARLGIRDQERFDELYGNEPDVDQKETWEINREMTARIAWKPYMFNPTLPVLLQGVDTPTLVVWGSEDRVVPLSCGRRYADALPNARLHIVDRCGHCVDVDRPKELAELVIDFLGTS